tara:strand:+ start:5383 stop:6087 length:705 start_codon:yes stop_codon:yes gene_type:complete
MIKKNMSLINYQNIKNYIARSYKLFSFLFITCTLLLTFFYKTTERVFTAKIDIQDIDLISYNSTFPGLLDNTSGVVGLDPSEINYLFYKTMLSRQTPLSSSHYSPTFNFNLFAYKGNKLYLYYYQKKNDNKIKENLNNFILDANKILCKKLFDLISYEIIKIEKFAEKSNYRIEQLTLWKNNIKENPKIVSWDIELAEIKTNLPYLKSYLITSFLLSLFVPICILILLSKFKKN